MTAGALWNRTRRRSLVLGAAASALILLPLIAFAALADDVSNARFVVRLDQDVADHFHERATPALMAFFSIISWFGSPQWLALVTLATAVFLVRRKMRQETAIVLAVYMGAVFWNTLLKLEFERPRPLLSDPLDQPHGFSFPSGHSMLSIAVYGAIAYLIAKELHSTSQRIALICIATLSLAAIGFSRVYLRAHFVSDVLAGLAAGLAWLIVCLIVARITRDLQSRSRGCGGRLEAPPAK